MSLYTKINNFLFNKRIRFDYLQKLGFYNHLNDQDFLKKKFKIVLEYELDLKHLRTFNEKLQWLKLNDRKDIYSTMVDKIEAKKYVSRIIGKNHIIPTLQVCDCVENLRLDELPDKFVIKCNHNSGLGMYICKDKKEFQQEKKKIYKNLKKGLEQDYYLHNREWPYKNVKRKILVEKFMENASGEALVDYKVMCFEGEPKIIKVVKKWEQTPTQDFYDLSWKKLDLSESDMPVSDIYIEKPVFLDEMIDLSRKLAKGLHHIRVDWYYINGTLYFGELTFYDGAGFDRFNPRKYEKIMGDWITLPIDEQR